MTISAIVGMQWGDEGKGKIVDALSDSVEIVVRCQGGANAGHTVVLGDKVYKLHVIPSGILRKGVTSVVGNGVVLDPLSLVGEIRNLEALGVQVEGRLLVSDRAHLVMPWHRILDGLCESSLGKMKIGTTGRGIGPTYADKMARTSLRGHELLDAALFARKVKERLAVANRQIEFYGGQPLVEETVVTSLEEARKYLAPFICDTVDYLHVAYSKGKSMLMEGAQGTHLDIDFGTYPYVTSSNTTSGGFSTGSGLPPMAIDAVHGIFKAFTSRVGEGPFPTELLGEMAVCLRGTGKNQWDEFGTTTGRPRRCGWCDLVVGRFSARLNGVTHLHLTKLDCLTGLPEIKICMGYELDGKNIDTIPADGEALGRCKPVYETLPGWTEDLTAVRHFDALPPAARNYARKIFENLGMREGTVNIGPRRDQSIPYSR